jgi:hypothetical protein
VRLSPPDRPLIHAAALATAVLLAFAPVAAAENLFPVPDRSRHLYDLASALKPDTASAVERALDHATVGPAIYIVVWRPGVTVTGLLVDGDHAELVSEWGNHWNLGLASYYYRLELDPKGGHGYIADYRSQGEFSREIADVDATVLALVPPSAAPTAATTGETWGITSAMTWPLFGLVLAAAVGAGLWLLSRLRRLPATSTDDDRWVIQGNPTTRAALAPNSRFESRPAPPPEAAWNQDWPQIPVPGRAPGPTVPVGLRPPVPDASPVSSQGTDLDVLQSWIRDSLRRLANEGTLVIAVDPKGAPVGIRMLSTTGSELVASADDATLLWRLRAVTDGQGFVRAETLQQMADFIAPKPPGYGGYSFDARTFTDWWRPILAAAARAALP